MRRRRRIPRATRQRLKALTLDDLRQDLAEAQARGEDIASRQLVVEALERWQRAAVPEAIDVPGRETAEA